MSAISRRYVADRGARLAGIPLPVNKIAGRKAKLVMIDEYSAIAAEFPLPCALSSQDRAPAAEADVSAALSIAYPDVGGQAETAPAENPMAPAPAGAVQLSEASHFILTLIAAHAGRSEKDVLAQLITSAGDAIGLSPLLKAAARDVGCLAGLPGYARAAANRFRSGGP